MEKKEYILEKTIKAIYCRPQSQVLFLTEGGPFLSGSGNNASGIVKDGEDVVPGGNFEPGDPDEGSEEAE